MLIRWVWTSRWTSEVLQEQRIRAALDVTGTEPSIPREGPCLLLGPSPNVVGGSMVGGSTQP